jgi:hypothetical protein
MRQGSLQSTNRLAATMCKFIIVKTLTGVVFRKGPALCNDGLNGAVCLDTTKIYRSSSSQTIMVKSGDAIVSTPSTTSIMMENLLQLSIVLIESGVVAPQFDRFMKAKIEHVEQMYFDLRREQYVYSPSSGPSSLPTADLIQTRRQTGQSRVKTISPSSIVSTESPTLTQWDSVSQVSKKSSSIQAPRPYELGTGAVVNWIEDSVTSTDHSSNKHRERRHSSRITSHQSMGSSRASHNGSKNMYTMTRQMTIRD